MKLLINRSLIWKGFEKHDVTFCILRCRFHSLPGQFYITSCTHQGYWYTPDNVDSVFPPLSPLINTPYCLVWGRRIWFMGKLHLPWLTEWVASGLGMLRWMETLHLQTGWRCQSRYTSVHIPIDIKLAELWMNYEHL